MANAQKAIYTPLFEEKKAEERERKRRIHKSLFTLSEEDLDYLDHLEQKYGNMHMRESLKKFVTDNVAACTQDDEVPMALTFDDVDEEDLKQLEEDLKIIAQKREDIIIAQKHKLSRKEIAHIKRGVSLGIDSNGNSLDRRLSLEDWSEEQHKIRDMLE